METYEKRYAIVIGDDLNLSLDHGVRDRLLHDLCEEFSLDTANGIPLADDPNMLTFRSSCQSHNRLDYDPLQIGIYEFLCHILNQKKLGNCERDRSSDGSLL